MSLTNFPRGAPHCVQLPVPMGSSPLGQVPSWRVDFCVEDVPVFDPATVSADAVDEDGYFPINACFLEAVACRPGIGEDSTVYMDDGLSRCSVYAMSAVIIPAPGVDPVKQQIDFKIKLAGGNANTTVLIGSANVNPGAGGGATKSPFRGLVGAVSGILCNQFEFWARVNAQAVQVPQPLKIRIQMIVDRLGSQGFGYLSVLDIDGTVLPVIFQPPPGP